MCAITPGYEAFIFICNILFHKAQWLFIIYAFKYMLNSLKHNLQIKKAKDTFETEHILFSSLSVRSQPSGLWASVCTSLKWGQLVVLNGEIGD